MLRRVDVAFLLTGAVLPALGAFVAVPALQAAGVPREAAGVRGCGRCNW